MCKYWNTILVVLLDFDLRCCLCFILRKAVAFAINACLRQVSGSTSHQRLLPSEPFLLPREEALYG